MRERQHFVALDEYEHGILIDSLNEKRKDLMNEGKTTDAVDELIVKVGHAPQKKFKVIERDKDKRREAR
ncbi:MAG: hypothetical protein ACLUJF_09535 [Ruminococcus sp.]